MRRKNRSPAKTSPISAKLEGSGTISMSLAGQRVMGCQIAEW
jgi:hypothetical protein